MLLSILLLGVLLGVRHALEADHVAAVASLATRARSTAEVVKVAAAWGLGHALALLSFGSALIALGLTLSERLEQLFEIAVGILLVALGADVLRRLRAGRVHLHAHQHDDGTVHLHAHRHHGGREQVGHPFDHEHYHPAIGRAVLVGGVHGLAGSAALVLLSVQATASVAEAIAYLAAFGAGSTFGMVAFSLAMTLPLRFSVRRVETPLHRVELVLGCASIAIGVWVVARASGWT